MWSYLEFDLAKTEHKSLLETLKKKIKNLQFNLSIVIAYKTEQVQRPLIKRIPKIDGL